jgi:hypothetical protein
MQVEALQEEHGVLQHFLQPMVASVGSACSRPQTMSQRVHVRGDAGSSSRLTRDWSLFEQGPP